MFTVLFEDSAAMLGLVVALLGIGLGQWLDMPILDGAASIVIGVILAVTAALLAYECKGLLIGEGASPHVVDGIRKMIAAEVGIVTVNEVLTMHLGPQDVLLNLSVDFGDQFSAGDVEATITRLERRIKEAFPEITPRFCRGATLARPPAEPSAGARMRTGAPSAGGYLTAPERTLRLGVPAQKHGASGLIPTFGTLGFGLR